MPLVERNGVACGIPLEVGVVPMHTRTGLLEAAGMGIPQAWSEMRAFARAATKPPCQYGLGIPISGCNDSESSMLAIIWSFGGGYFDEKGNVSFDTPETRAARKVFDNYESSKKGESAVFPVF